MYIERIDLLGWVWPVGGLLCSVSKTLFIKILPNEMTFWAYVSRSHLWQARPAKAQHYRSPTTPLTFPHSENWPDCNGGQSSLSARVRKVIMRLSSYGNFVSPVVKKKKRTYLEMDTRYPGARNISVVDYQKDHRKKLCWNAAHLYENKDVAWEVTVPDYIATESTKALNHILDSNDNAYFVVSNVLLGTRYLSLTHVM